MSDDEDGLLQSTSKMQKVKAKDDKEEEKVPSSFNYFTPKLKCASQLSERN